MSFKRIARVKSGHTHQLLPMHSHSSLSKCLWSSGIDSIYPLKENGMEFRRWRPEEVAAFVLTAPDEDEFKASNFAFFASGWPVFSDCKFFGTENMSMSVRCRFKGFEADPDASALSWEALGVVDASRDDDAPYSTSAR